MFEIIVEDKANNVPFEYFFQSTLNQQQVL